MAGAGTQMGALRASGLLDEDELVDIEGRYPKGMSSREIVDVFASRGLRFSEATLRKYVQLGLLPRSVRVGRKGKHCGSRGLYPAGVVRRVNQVKALMARNLTIEEIQRSFARFKQEIEEVSKGLRDLIAGFEREAKGPALNPERRQEIEREIEAAKHAAGELVRRISGLEASFSSQAAAAAAGTAAGGGSDLY
ncbi:MAG TPA: MerR family transcriptional regulator [Polyangia bacterium]|nr:MerR family transcriptional regulator [Polyangia bacterium]